MEKVSEYKKPVIEELEQNVHLLTFEDEKKLFLIGTAHVSRESAELVEKVIKEQSPDTVCIELDEQRLKALKEKNKYENLDIIKIIRTGQVYFFIGNLILSSFQKKMAEKTGVEPGSEFKKAIDIAEENNLKLALVDRNIGVTLKRAWRLTGFWSRMTLLSSLLFNDSKEVDEINENNIEELKKMDALTEIISELGDEMPVAKRVLIDERDTYMTGLIQKNLGNATVAVVGAGHVPGMLQRFSEQVPEKTLDEISYIPPESVITRAIPWLLPAIIIGIFIWGFFAGSKEVATDFVIIWVLATGGLSALGCILAMAHPVTTISAFLAAPITTLHPMLGAGMVTAVVQTVIVKPRVIDFMNLQDDVSKFGKQLWLNRVTRILLVFVLSSLGAASGTFIALPALVNFLGG